MNRRRLLIPIFALWLAADSLGIAHALHLLAEHMPSHGHSHQPCATSHGHCAADRSCDTTHRGRQAPAPSAFPGDGLHAGQPDQPAWHACQFCRVLTLGRVAFDLPRVDSLPLHEAQAVRPDVAGLHFPIDRPRRTGGRAPPLA